MATGTEKNTGSAFYGVKNMVRRFRGSIQVSDK